MNNTAEDFIAKGGRIFHRRERNRTITVAYLRFGPGGKPRHRQCADDDKHGRGAFGEVMYGATIHNKVSTKDQWNRKAHIHTAISRLAAAPVTITDWANSAHERKRLIRKAIASIGCKGNSTR